MITKLKEVMVRIRVDVYFLVGFLEVNFCSCGVMVKRKMKGR